MLSLLSHYAIQVPRSIPPQSTARVISVGAFVVGRKLFVNPTQNRMAFSTTTTATDRKRQQYLLSLPKFVVPEQKWAHYQMHAGGRTNAEKTRRHIKQVGQMYRRKMQKA